MVPTQISIVDLCPAMDLNFGPHSSEKGSFNVLLYFKIINFAVRFFIYSTCYSEINFLKEPSQNHLNISLMNSYILEDIVSVYIGEVLARASQPTGDRDTFFS